MASGLAVSKSESYLFSPIGKFVAHKKIIFSMMNTIKWSDLIKTIKDSSP